VFSGASAPNTVSSDVNAVELGMKFRSSVAGSVTAISYFKATGAPVATKSGHLWSSTGQLLASVVFSKESASGWQQATLSSSVDIAAATTYVVSYFAPKGGYTSTHNYFTTTIVNGPLTVPATGNDTFCYARTACFPNQTYTASNYYVDLVFVPSSDPVTTPTTAPTTVAPSTTTTTPAPTTASTSASTTTTAATSTTTTATSTSTTTLPATTIATTVPSGGQSQNCMSSPHLCGFPDAMNTGVLAGVTLTQITSSSVSGPGWHCRSNPCQVVIVDGGGGNTTLGSATTGYELADGITMFVTAPNITIQNLKVDGAHGADTWAVGVCGTGSVGFCPGGAAANNFTIRNCDLIGAPDSTANVSSPLRGNAGVLTYPGQTNITVDHCHMHGFGTGGGLYIEQQKGAVVFTNSFVNHENCWDSTHNISCPASDSLYGSAYTDHTNAWHSGGGPGTDSSSSLLIRNNTLLNDYTPGDQTTALSLFNDSGSLTQTNINGLIDHNLFAAAGGFCMELQDSLGGSTVTYLKLKNNHYSQKFYANCGGSGINYNGVNLNGHGVGDAQCGNVWDDGPFAGSGADQNNRYPTSMQPVTPNTC